MKVRAKPLAQRKGTRSQKAAGYVGGGERFGLIIVGESKSAQVGPLSRRFMSADQWENGLVVECTVA